MRKFIQTQKETRLYERLLALVTRFSSGQIAQFADEIGMSESTFRTYLRESGEHKVRFVTIQRILKTFPQVSPIWLLTGDGGMILPGKFFDPDKDTVLALNDKPIGKIFEQLVIDRLSMPFHYFIDLVAMDSDQCDMIRESQRAPTYDELKNMARVAGADIAALITGVLPPKSRTKEQPSQGSAAPQSPLAQDILALEESLRRANASDETIQKAILTRIGATPPTRYPVAGETQDEVRVSEGPSGVQEDQTPFGNRKLRVPGGRKDPSGKKKD